MGSVYATIHNKVKYAIIKLCVHGAQTLDVPAILGNKTQICLVVFKL